jgi:hypothetical protein
MEDVCGICENNVPVNHERDLSSKLRFRANAKEEIDWTALYETLDLLNPGDPQSTDSAFRLKGICTNTFTISVLYRTYQAE